ncbi:MAG: S-adenosyl-l-methionine hydroxide adenosyltransferase family protein [Rhodospirillaceae bacterium]
MAIVLFTDFGADLYVGQVKAVLLEYAAAVPVIDLVHDAPAFDIAASAHLLSACVPRFAPGSIFLAVVDPGVGTERGALVGECDGRILVGPDNGLLSVCGARASTARFWSIAWRPEALSNSFHGRDLFAPIAGTIASGQWPESRLAPKPAPDVTSSAEDTYAIIYIDRYGNACTGVRASRVSRNAVLSIAGVRLRYAPVFGAVETGAPFWYENSLGLVEIAAHRASAAATLGLQVGARITVE